MSRFLIRKKLAISKTRSTHFPITNWIYPSAIDEGTIDIITIEGVFQPEEIDLYSDSDFSTLVQRGAAIITGSSTGRCNYSGSETSCNRSFTRCEELNNGARFGGFPGLANSGLLK